MPLNSLRAFAAIYASGGVRAVARKLGIAHSSVSRHLAELEAWLGVSLTLKGKRLRLTACLPPVVDKLVVREGCSYVDVGSQWLSPFL